MSTPPSPAFSPTPPPRAALRNATLAHARARGWLVAPNGLSVAENCAAAFRAGTLPDVKPLLTPPASPQKDETGREGDGDVVDVDELARELDAVLKLPEVREEVEEEEKIDVDGGGVVRPKLKYAERWLGRGGDFERGREKAAVRLMRIFDEEVLGGVLGGEVGGRALVTLSWSGRLTKTAGVTRMKRVGGGRVASVELSRKVVDEAGRLYCTLAHELCHVAAWVVDDVARPPHGEVFKKWARRFREWDGELVISRCHEYEIRYKFEYFCVDCALVYGRHSRSIDVAKKVCGRCRGRLRLREGGK